MEFKRAFFTLAVVAVLGAGCESRPAKPRLGEIERLPRVETLQPVYAQRPVTIDTLATVEPMERSRLSAQVQGEVKNLAPDIDIGRRIHKNEVLITLDIPAAIAEQESKKALLAQARGLRDQADEARKVAIRDVEEAVAQVARWKSDLGFKEVQLKRVEELVAKGTLQPILKEESELQRDTARAALEAAQATVNTKKAKLKSAEVELKVAETRIEVAKAEIRVADTKVEFAKIRAPFDGVITRRWVDNGAIIKDPSQPLLTVMRTDWVRVMIDIPEKYAPLIRAKEGQSPKGEATWVTLNMGGHQEKEPIAHPEQITRQAAAIDPQTRLLRAEIHLRNDSNLALRPGATGTAIVVLDDGKKPRLNIPSTALVRVGDQIRVYYVDDLSKDKPPKGVVKMHEVRIGLDDGKTVEITAGLPDNALVIAKGNGVVRQGEIVLAVPALPQRTYR